MISYQFRRLIQRVINASLSIQKAQASGNLTLTGAAQDVPGASLILLPGRYLVIGVFDFSGSTGDGVGVGLLDVGGTDEATQAIMNLTANIRSTVVQVWNITVSIDTTVKLQGYKTGGTGSSIIGATHTTITAVRLGA